MAQTGNAWSTLLELDFWDFFISNLLTVELWGGYAVDIAIALAFGALGAYGDIKQLYTETKLAPVEPVEPASVPEPSKNNV